MPKRLWLVVIALFVAAASFAEEPSDKKSFEPYVGLPGKDVIWLPAELIMVDKMMELAQVTPEDVVMDLGSGDGRTVIGAAKRGALGIGVEFNPEMVQYARRNAEKEGVAARALFERGDLFEADLSRATVITLFLLPAINMKLRPKLLELKPGTRIIGNTFTMEDWEADATIQDPTKGESCSFNCMAYLWMIPAKAAGKWRFSDGEIELTQRFQMLSGTLRTSGAEAPVQGKLLGDRIRLSGGGMEFRGRVTGNSIEGAVQKQGTPVSWKATR